MPYEYTQSSVGANGCSYSTLNSYNQNYFGRGQMNMAPQLSQTRSNEVVVIPGFGGSSYNILNSGVQGGNCNGYYSIQDAYPQYPNACGAFSSALCGSANARQ